MPAKETEPEPPGIRLRDTSGHTEGQPLGKAARCRAEHSWIRDSDYSGCPYSLDWSTGLDYWTGLLDSRNFMQKL